MTDPWTSYAVLGMAILLGGIPTIVAARAFEQRLQDEAPQSPIAGRRIQDRSRCFWRMRQR